MNILYSFIPRYLITFVSVVTHGRSVQIDVFRHLFLIAISNCHIDSEKCPFYVNDGTIKSKIKSFPYKFTAYLILQYVYSDFSITPSLITQ